MREIAIFTAVLGDYDEIRQPEVVDERFDYFLFTDKEFKVSTIGVWQIKHFDISHIDRTKRARWIKTHPEELLPEYKASLWIDGNICICKKTIYSLCFEHLYQEHLFALLKHPERSCIYQELLTVLACHFERESVALRWGSKIAKEGYPQNNGLCETGLLFRIHTNPKVKELDIQWWNCINSFSKRDQLSFNYLIWRNSLNYHYLISEDANVRCSNMFSYFEHSKNATKEIKYKRNEAWLCRHLSKYPEERSLVYKAYYLSYKSVFPQITAFALGQYYRIKDFIRRKYDIHHNM